MRVRLWQVSIRRACRALPVIHVIRWVSVQPSSKPAQPPGPLRNATGEDLNLATRARSFVAAIQSRWSDANSSGLAWLDAVYAQDVDYYASAFLGMRYLLTNVASLNAGRSDRTKSQPIQ